MAGRTRTTKKLAQRIDRNYFKNRFPFTRWRFNLSLVLTAIGVLWLAWHAVAKNPHPYTSGPISVRHAIFSDNCAACHVRNGTFVPSVTDQACSTCHNGPAHQAQETFAPECTSCHVEHKGALALTRADSATTPSARLQYQVAPKSMVYVSYSEGFKAGGFNFVQNNANPTQYPFDPEHVKAYEIGTKNELFDNRVVLNVAADVATILVTPRLRTAGR